MSSLHLCQFFLYSFCIHLFTIFTYFVYYTDLFSVKLQNDLQMEYDYIIVGSGTGGSVVAHRMSTETNYSFIVLEAGSRSHFLLDIPIVGPAIHRSIFDWSFESVPQENACFAMHGKKCRLPQGKITGGSSKLNNMIHFRGNISHYVQWFHSKYTKDYLEKHFKHIENNLLHLQQLSYESDLASTIIKAAKELGYEEFTEKSGLGFSKTKLSQKNGKRWSLSDNLDPKYIITNAEVERVIIVNEEAIGVSINYGGVRKDVLARKGVILAAGSYNTPKILQLSGVGPAKLLESLKIPVIRDLPVGKNLQDHVASGLDLIMLDKYPGIGGHDIVNPVNSLQYFLFGKGPLTTPGCEVVAFVSTKNDSVPDLQFMVLPTGLTADRGSRLRKSLGITDEIWNKYFVKTLDKYTATILPIILHPKSRGTVFINSTDPKEPPLIDPKFFSNTEDREVIVNGLKLAKILIETNAMKDFGASINPILFPGCSNLFSNEYWKCYIKHLTLSSYHPVGTCSMGLPVNSVVDTSFKVHGIRKLYVADASVLPALPSGNINAAVAMMASIFFENTVINAEYEYVTNGVCYRDHWSTKYLVEHKMALNFCGTY